MGPGRTLPKLWKSAKGLRTASSPEETDGVDHEDTRHQGRQPECSPWKEQTESCPLIPTHVHSTGTCVRTHGGNQEV